MLLSNPTDCSPSRARSGVLAALLALASLIGARPVPGADAAASTAPAVPARLALVGGMLLDGYGGEPVHHATVLVEGNRIVYAGPSSATALPPGTTVLDTRGATMMPGMIELHAHLILVGHGDYDHWFAWLAQHRDRWPMERVMALSAQQLLAAGITSAVDLGAPLEASRSVRERIRSGEIPGPRLSISGPWLTGAASLFPADCQRVVKDAAQAARATEDNIRGGVDVIKAHQGLDLERYRAIVAVAHRHGIKVHAHLYDERAVRSAFEAGVDVLQHVGSAGLPPYDPELVRAIAADGRPVVPTAAHRAWLFPDTRAFPERLEDPEIRRGFPSDLWEEVHASLEHFHTLGYFVNREQEEFFASASLGQWIRGGAVIGVGSDNGTVFNFHRDALWREAKVLADNGLPPARVISALTWVNARILGKDQELGTVEPGKLADILVVRRNPLFDPVALADVEWVVKDGRLYREGKPVTLADATQEGSP